MKKRLFNMIGHTKCINAIFYYDINNILINRCILLSNKGQAHQSKIVLYII